MNITYSPIFPRICRKPRAKNVTMQYNYACNTYKDAGAPRDQPFVLLLLCSVSTSSHSDLIVCLTKGLGNSEIC